jgi:hypothetical protein
LYRVIEKRSQEKNAHVIAPDAAPKSHRKKIVKKKFHLSLKKYFREKQQRTTFADELTLGRIPLPVIDSPPARDLHLSA